MTRPHSEVFSAFPEIPMSRNRDPKTTHNNSGGCSVHFHAFRQLSEASSSRVVQKSSLKSLFVFSPILALVFHEIEHAVSPVSYQQDRFKSKEVQRLSNSKQGNKPSVTMLYQRNILE